MDKYWLTWTDIDHQAVAGATMAGKVTETKHPYMVLHHIKMWFIFHKILTTDTPQDVFNVHDKYLQNTFYIS